MRKRSQPWIQRRSRFIIAAISAVGAVITAYLAFTKLSGGEATCPIEGCDKVLESPYATVFGLPLALFGLLAYVAMELFAVVPWLVNPETQKSLRKDLENWTWIFLLIGSTSMAVFSAYLMYVMTTEIQSLCVYCIGSAVCAVSLFALALMGREWDDRGQVMFIGTIAALVTMVGTLAVYAPLRSTTAEDESGYAITQVSTPDRISLARHLTEINAKMYGAFWCGHCLEQKERFGEEAAKEMPYIECDPNGTNPQPALCDAAGIQSYPTWEINGQFYQGNRTLDELADFSGYEGSREF
ncbi:MAG: vitamin K epoxide reductase family protein [Cyanobacteria bacterium SID2]|nr:vitamin K epoxide reductase family protein [Cyanobacteria bacterium SID2]MBP0006552.1 vitamin K epoxide reductase family protein [Cyanobacteria bacterium SBC]